MRLLLQVPRTQSSLVGGERARSTSGSSDMAVAGIDRGRRMAAERIQGVQVLKSHGASL